MSFNNLLNNWKNSLGRWMIDYGHYLVREKLSEEFLTKAQRFTKVTECCKKFIFYLDKHEYQKEINSHILSQNLPNNS